MIMEYSVHTLIAIEKVLYLISWLYGANFLLNRLLNKYMHTKAKPLGYENIMKHIG